MVSQTTTKLMETVQSNLKLLILPLFLYWYLNVVCCTLSPSPDELKKGLKLPVNSSTSRPRQTKINEINENTFSNELSSIKKMLSSIKRSSVTQSSDLHAIKQLVQETNVTLKSNETKVTSNMTSNVISNASVKPNAVKKTFAALFQSDKQQRTPKRILSQMSENAPEKKRCRHQKEGRVM